MEEGKKEMLVPQVLCVLLGRASERTSASITECHLHKNIAQVSAVSSEEVKEAVTELLSTERILAIDTNNLALGRRVCIHPSILREAQLVERIQLLVAFQSESTNLTVVQIGVALSLNDDDLTEIHRALDALSKKPTYGVGGHNLERYIRRMEGL